MTLTTTNNSLTSCLDPYRTGTNRTVAGPQSGSDWSQVQDGSLDSITVETDDFGERTYTVDADTFLRPVNPGVREPVEKFTEVTRPGMRLQVLVDGHRAPTLRRLMVL